MKNAKNGDTLALAGFDQIDDDSAVGGVERGRGLVEQQDGPPRRQAAGDVDTLLLATGERRRRQVPEPPGDVQPAQQIAARLTRRVGGIGLALAYGSGDDVEGADARDGAQELADVAERGLPARRNDLPGSGGLATSVQPARALTRMRPASAR